MLHAAIIIAPIVWKESESLSAWLILRYDRTMRVRLPPPRRPLLWQWLLGLCLIGCLGYIAWALHDFYERRQLAEVIAEIEAVDPHWRWEELQARRPSIPDDQNMGHAINDIVIGLRLHNMPPKMKDLPALPWKDAYVELFTKYKIEDYDVFLEHHPNAALPRGWKEPVEKVMQMSPAPVLLNKMRQLTKYRTGRFEHMQKKTDMLLVDAQGSHTIKEFLSYDVLLSLEAGDSVAASRDCAAILASARVYDHDDFPTSLMIRYSVVSTALRSLEQILARSNSVPTETLVQLQQAFESEESGMPALASSLRFYRAYQDHVLSEAQKGTITLADFMDQKRSSTFPARKATLTGWKLADDTLEAFKPELFLESWARPQSWTMERRHMLQFHNELLVWARLEDHRLLPELQRLKREGVSLSPFFAAIYGRTHSEYQTEKGYRMIENMARGYLNHRVACRAGAAGLAVERYRLEHGDWPASWEQLIPKYLAKVPIDPFTAKPLLMKSQPDYLVIYSVGVNGIDDGGIVTRVSIKQPALDFGIRLWKPAQRGVDMSEDIKKLEAEWQNEP